MKPLIAVTMGDFNGIGPEVALKSLTTSHIERVCSPVLIGSLDVFEYYAQRSRIKIKLIGFDQIPPKYRPPGRHSRTGPDSIPVIQIGNGQKLKIKPGVLSDEAGLHAGNAIETAARLCLQNEVDGLVTAPVSKEVMNKAGYDFPGQTEMLATLSEAPKVMMMLIAGHFRVGLTTIHIPLKKVSSELSKQKIFDKLRMLSHALKNDFKIRAPRIAVLGINPHAGEHGLIGKEEVQHILPAIKRAKRSRIEVEGPFAADGFFGTHAYKHYDAILAMYHDQGLIPLKLLGFNIGVNYTIGLPFVRTSPDHGTAFNIAGKGKANPSSMIEAIKLAAQLIQTRQNDIVGLDRRKHHQ